MTRRKTDSPTLFDDPDVPTDAIERRLRASGLSAIAGVDEAGRGPLAGPVVAAAVILDPDRIPHGLDDSKKLSAARREILYEAIIASAAVAIAAGSVSRIDATDIRQATLWAMRQAVAALPVAADYALIDGKDVPPALSCRGEALVKGDARSVSIAAASIVAKVTRDRMMRRLARRFPDYGFDRHMGYGTAAHLAALARHGVTPIHRMSFAPIRALAAVGAVSGQESGEHEG